jgi:hypothetical protein
MFRKITQPVLAGLLGAAIAGLLAAPAQGADTGWGIGPGGPATPVVAVAGR